MAPRWKRKAGAAEATIPQQSENRAPANGSVAERAAAATTRPAADPVATRPFRLGFGRTPAFFILRRVRRALDTRRLPRRPGRGPMRGNGAKETRPGEWWDPDRARRDSCEVGEPEGRPGPSGLLPRSPVLFFIGRIIPQDEHMKDPQGSTDWDGHYPRCPKSTDDHCRPLASVMPR
jgi:hypothetical protein